MTSTKDIGVLRLSRTTWAIVLLNDPNTVIETGFRSQKAAHARCRELIAE